MFHPNIIPWKSKAEWIDVYNKIFSKNYEEVLEAIETLRRWHIYMERSYRPGMDCTRGIQQVTVKDKHFYPDTKKTADLHDLQLMYSAEIMRFLNLVNDPAGKGNKKVSMYGRAKEIDIPDWVVNIRHQMAHGHQLPSIDALRIAAEFILNWLKVNYWEKEKNTMQEISVENIQNVIQESLPVLLNIYISLKEQHILGFKKIRDIQDPDMKDLIYGINRFSMREVMIRCRPWELMEGEDICINLQKLNEYSISRVVYLVLRLLKQFIYPEKMYGVNTINILAKKLIDDSIKHNGIRCYVWSTFLKSIHSWLKFPSLIRALTDKSYENTGEGAYQAGIWNVELCKALQKRFQVEILRNTLIKESITGKFSNSKRKNKLINLNPSERKEFTKLLLKKKLNLIGQSDNKILACIFHRVEQTNPNLRHVIRLQDPIFPNHWEIVDLIEYIALKPTDYSEHCLQALFNVMKWPMNSKSIFQLIKLGKIYRGEGVSTQKLKRVFKSFNLGENMPIMGMEKQLREIYPDIYKHIDSKLQLCDEENSYNDTNEFLNENEKFLDKSEFVTHDVVPNTVFYTS